MKITLGFWYVIWEYKNFTYYLDKDGVSKYNTKWLNKVLLKAFLKALDEKQKDNQ